MGRYPARRVLKKAVWVAEELKNSDWRRMKYPNLYLALDSLDENMRDQTLADPNEYVKQFERQITLDSIEDRLEREGLFEVLTVFRLLRHGYRWHEIAGQMSTDRADLMKRRFYRWIKKLGSA